MNLTRYDDIHAFNRATEAFLLEREAQNNLLLGISVDLARSTLYADIEPYLATVSDDGGVMAAALWTPPHNLVLTRAPSEAIELIADDLLAHYPDLPGVLAPSDTSRAFSEAWRQRTDREFHAGTLQRIYQLERVHAPEDVPGSLRRVERSDAELLVAWLAAFEREAYGAAARARSVDRLLEAYLEGRVRGLYLWEDGQPVSMAGHSGPTPNGIRVGPVYTPPEYRQRGYGTALTAALNPTSNSIYQRIGYRPVVDVDEYRFEGVGSR